MKKLLVIFGVMGFTLSVSAQAISCSNSKTNYEDLIIPEEINVEGWSIEEKINFISLLENKAVKILGEKIFNEAKWSEIKECKLLVNYTNFLVSKKPNIYTWNDKEWSKIINLQNNLIKALPLWLEINKQRQYKNEK